VVSAHHRALRRRHSDGYGPPSSSQPRLRHRG
jgi:hypothetical protein